LLVATSTVHYKLQFTLTVLQVSVSAVIDDFHFSASSKNVAVSNVATRISIDKNTIWHSSTTSE